MSFGKDEITLDSTKHLLKINWSHVKINDKDYSIKFKFDEDSYELLLSDLHELKLYYAKENQNQILETFKVTYLRPNFINIF
jgi:hypothetical protein